jgi:hypothetical protein
MSSRLGVRGKPRPTSSLLDTLHEPSYNHGKRIWVTVRTIMLRSARRTSKRVKEVVDEMRLLVVVRLRRSSWDDCSGLFL